MTEGSVFDAPGSMTPASELTSRIENPAERAKRRQKAATDETDAPETEEPEVEESEGGDEQYTADGLPRQVVVTAPGAVGRMIPYEEFKKRHKSIYGQVDDGRLIVPGFVASTVRLLRQDWEVRTLRRREQEAMQEVGRRAGNEKELASLVEVIRLAVQVTKFKGEALEPLPEFTATEFDKWLKTPTVEQRIRMFRDMAQEVTDYLILHILEAQQAVQFAVHESSINP